MFAMIAGGRDKFIENAPTLFPKGTFSLLGLGIAFLKFGEKLIGRFAVVHERVSCFWTGCFRGASLSNLPRIR